ncbi:hypothetical protein EV175_001266 [Coemansia sp. RSA 1933]|nr:hypothetical protein EV175_001266 [Coemansia sp. RSA 1933]
MLLRFARLSGGARLRHTLASQSQLPPWTPEAKDRLLAIVHKHKEKDQGNWDQIASFIQAIPLKAQSIWTEEESRELLAHIQEKYIKKRRKFDWDSIGRHLGRSAFSSYQRYYVLLRKHRGQDDEIEDWQPKPVLHKVKRPYGNLDTWTAEEIARLREVRGPAARGQRRVNWKLLAQKMDIGRTSVECKLQWYRLVQIDERRRTKKADTRGDPELWTASEVAQMDALAMQKFTRKKGSVSRMETACAMFPHKDQAAVRRQMWRSMRREHHRVVQGRKDHARRLFKQTPDADIRTVSAATGLSEHMCLQVLNSMEQVACGVRRWSRAEFRRMEEAIAAHGHNKVDWYAVAAKVGTRTHLQCYRKYYVLHGKQNAQ